MTNNEKKKRENNHFIFNLFPFRGTEPGSSAYTAKTSQSQRWLIFDEFYHLCLLLKTHLMLTERCDITSCPVVVLTEGWGTVWAHFLFECTMAGWAQVSREGSRTLV